MGRSAGNRQGISHCLESGHPVVWCKHMLCHVTLTCSGTHTALSILSSSQGCTVISVCETDHEPVFSQLRRRKWNWLGHTLRRSNDTIMKQVLQRAPHGHRGRGRTALQLEENGSDSTRQLHGQEQSVAWYVALGVTRHRSSQSSFVVWYERCCC